LHSLRRRSKTKKRLKNIARYLKIKRKENNGFLDSKKFIDVLEKHNRNVFKKTGNKISGSKEIDEFEKDSTLWLSTNKTMLKLWFSD
jgi:hypothetical protein